MSDAPKRMSPERLEELLRAAVQDADAPNPVVRVLLAEQRELIAEIEALRADNNRVLVEAIRLAVEARKLAAECEAARARLTPLGVAYRTLAADTASQPNAVAYAAARAATDASGALARHGGGA